MSKLNEAKDILQNIGMPSPQTAELCCYTLLAMANLKENEVWSISTNEWIRIHDILGFIAKNYGVQYAENSRETFRKQAIHHFRTAAIIEDNGKATNSPNYRYRITTEALTLLRSYNSQQWSLQLKDFLEHHKTLISIYASKKAMEKLPVRINTFDLTFSPGKHNKLQKAIIEDFAPRFAPDSEVLYVGDTLDKGLYKDVDKLKQLGFEIGIHDKMPDVVLYVEKKDWLFFVEAVTSVGPMDPKRIMEITDMTRDVKSGKIFITAFLTMKDFKKFSEQLAWETEVWIAEMPNHMIHLNGDKFIGPR